MRNVTLTNPLAKNATWMFSENAICNRSATDLVQTLLDAREINGSVSDWKVIANGRILSENQPLQEIINSTDGDVSLTLAPIVSGASPANFIA